MLEMREPTAQQDPSQGGSFARDVIRLMFGSSAAQALAIAASPIIARLYAPSEYGLATVFASITSMVGVVAALRYECSILLPKEEGDSANAAALSMLVILLTTLLLFPAVWLAWPMLMRVLKEPGLAPFWPFVPAGVFLAGTMLVLTNWNARKQAYGSIAAAQFIMSVVNVGIQLSLGLSHRATGAAMIAANLLSSLIATVILGVQTWRGSSDVFRQCVNLPSIFHVRRRYQRFASYGTPSALMNNVSWQLPSFMLSAFFSSNVVGQYALGTRLTRVPINLLGLNISRVFNQRAADAHNNNTLPRTVGMTYHYLLRISVFPCLLLGVVGKEIFIVAFGARWAEAGVYCQILSVWVCFWFISSPLSSVLSIVEEQALELRINSLILASRFLSLLIGGLLGSARLALSAFAITGVLVYGYYCLLILNRSGSPASQAFRLLLTNTLVFLPFGLFLLLLKLMSVSPLWVVVAASLCLAAYYVWLVYVDSGARALLATVLRIAPARASPAASR